MRASLYHIEYTYASHPLAAAGPASRVGRGSSDIIMSVYPLVRALESHVGARIIATGKALPELRITNDELSKVVETDDEWISSRTGIRSRRIAIDSSSLEMASASCAPLFGSADDGRGFETAFYGQRDIDPKSIDLIVFATITPDSIVPAMACGLREQLGCTNAIAFDLNAACSGFVYALSVAESMMAASHVEDGCRTQRIERALIVCSERLTRIVDWQDRNTCVLFGDGAGSCILEWDEGDAGVLSCYLQNEDDVERVLTCPKTYNSPLPFDGNGAVVDEELLARINPDGIDPKNVDYSYIAGLDIVADPARSHIDSSLGIGKDEAEGKPHESIRMDGKRVFSFASKILCSDIEEALRLAGLTLDDVAFIVPHQANERIIRFAAKRLGIGMERFQLSIEDCGNTSSASVPMALTDALLDAGLAAGDVIVVVAFGGGLTSGAAVIRL